jgi:hypothetical protein
MHTSGAKAPICDGLERAKAEALAYLEAKSRNSEVRWITATMTMPSVYKGNYGYIGD